MKKTLMALVVALFATMLMAGGAGAQTADVVVPDEEGNCPAGFEVAYEDDIGEVCTETLDAGEDAVDDGGDVTVTAAGTLPRTGSDSLPLAQIGAALVAAGGLAVLVTRKRAAYSS